VEVELAGLDDRGHSLDTRLETVAVKPKKAGITLRLVTLAWAPAWRDPAGSLTAVWP
jgi:hypothetical protein